MGKQPIRIDHLIIGILAGTLASYIFISQNNFFGETAVMLVIFNFLFVALTFPLNGTLKKKLLMLLIGNFTGLIWNTIFSLFAITAAYYLENFFNILWSILNPILNFLWIVSFWSLSLTILASSERGVSEIDS
ncbi:hypothetical protein DRO44_00920 [Candidatus Bathyarchaeota archaeon]|nr:MAG: hypothetical protein DRO44_00920 [Candidatus Bathyarchaeota archaeon]